MADVVTGTGVSLKADMTHGRSGTDQLSSLQWFIDRKLLYLLSA